MSGDPKYFARVVDLPPDVREAWDLLIDRYAEIGEVLIACISATEETGAPSVQFLTRKPIDSTEEMLRGLNALESAIQEIQAAVLSPR